LGDVSRFKAGNLGYFVGVQGSEIFFKRGYLRLGDFKKDDDLF
jgi:hypothetical protein